MATLSYNIPVSGVETLFLSADLASFVIAVSEMALLSLLLNEGRTPSQNSADININYIKSDSTLLAAQHLHYAMRRKLLHGLLVRVADEKRVGHSNIDQGNSRREF